MYKWKLRLKKIGLVLKTLAKSPKNISRVINWEKEAQNSVITKYGFANGLAQCNIMELTPEISGEVVNPYVFTYGSALSIEIALLKQLAKRVPNCRFLEIGTYKGETAANLANVCEKVVTIDISDEPYIGEFCKDYSNVEMIKVDSMTLDWSTLGEFDLIFIDGDHHHHAVKSDTINALKVLVPNGVIVWHDYIMRFDKLVDENAHIGWQVLAGILDGMEGKGYKNLYYVSNTMSAIYLDEELQCDNETNIFEVEIRCQETMSN